MARETLVKVMPHVFISEGGWSDHPSDPGGATMYGVTIGTLSAYRGRPVSKAEVRALTKAEATEIYRRNYWNAVKGDDLPAGIDWAVFDFAINSGPGRAIKYLQDICGVRIDGAMGPITLTAARNLDAAWIVNELCDDRLTFLRALKTWGTFGKGWSSRVARVRTTSLALIGSIAVPPPPDDPGIEMTPPSDARPSFLQTIIDLIARLFGR